ncbi:MAG TPA: alpha-galactosidase [Tepidisphaeraceae bacterium]|jgi:alpha-galactosidase
MRKFRLALLLVLFPLAAAPAPAQTLSFTVDGTPSADLLPLWDKQEQERKLDDNRSEKITTYTDPKTKLSVRRVMITYTDIPAVKWTFYLKNDNVVDSPLLENIQPLDVATRIAPDVPITLHHNTGSPCTPTDYQPLETKLTPGVTKAIATSGGRPTNSDLPYFNLELPKGVDEDDVAPQGRIIVIGWPGQWSAKFSRDNERFSFSGGQELTRLRLHPGEQIRTPLVFTMSYTGDWIDGQNKFRRWMINHNIPRIDWKVPTPEITPCSSHQVEEMVHANEKVQLQFIDRYLEEKIPINYWWMDAGWYILPNGTWPNTGTWTVDPARFPRGIRAISDHAHSKGVKTILWFEMERVTPNTELYKHSEWLLGKDGEQKLLNMGNPAARKWATDHVLRVLSEQGIDLFRMDFNIDPLPYWRANDSEDRQGITEIRYVEGYLAFLDELIKRHGNLRIDTCASGGRRNDLETLRRATPLLRSDYILEPLGQQQHTYGISLWIPFYGTGVNSADPYVFQSQMCPHITPVYDVRKTDLDYNGIRKQIAAWQQVAPLYYADFYPLTPYSTAANTEMGWQFNDPEKKQGFVQAFRRPESPNPSLKLKLRGLDVNKTYDLVELNTDKKWTASGADLQDKGLQIDLPNKSSAALIHYK